MYTAFFTKDRHYKHVIKSYQCTLLILFKPLLLRKTPDLLVLMRESAFVRTVYLLSISNPFIGSSANMGFGHWSS